MPSIGTMIGPSRGRGKAAAAFVGMVLSGTGTQAEGTAIATAIGTLSVVGGTGTYTFTKTADPDSAFTLAAGVLKNAIVFDYETAATHSVTLHADNGAGSTFDLTVIVAVTDVAAPVLSAPTGTKTGSTTGTLGVTTDSGNGTLYAVATTSATNPTKAQVKAGQDHTGAAAAFAGSQAISSSGAKTINATGLTPSTAYFAHFMHEGLPAEQSAVIASASFTTDVVSAPVNTVAPAVTGTATVGQTLTTTNGTWTNSPTSYAYQWYQSVTSGGVPTTDVDGNYIGIAISAATASTYVLQAGDVGELIFCDVTATNAGGSTLKSSNVTAAVSGGSSVTFTKTDNQAVSNPGASTKTYTAAALGATAADRITIVVVNTHSVIATGVTVGGLSATKAVEESSTISGLQIWYVDSHTLSTAEDIVVTAGGTLVNIAIQVGRLVGATVAPTATNSSSTGATDPSTVNVTVPASGVAVVAVATSALTAGAWGNATGDYNTNGTDIATESLALAHTTTTGSVTPSYTGLNSGNAHMVIAAWGL